MFFATKSLMERAKGVNIPSVSNNRFLCRFFQQGDVMSFWECFMFFSIEASSNCDWVIPTKSSRLSEKQPIPPFIPQIISNGVYIHSSKYSNLLKVYPLFDWFLRNLREQQGKMIIYLISLCICLNFVHIYINLKITWIRGLVNLLIDLCYFFSF